MDLNIVNHRPLMAALISLILAWGCQESGESDSIPAAIQHKIHLSPVKEVASYAVSRGKKPPPVPAAHHTATPGPDVRGSTGTTGGAIDPFRLPWHGTGSLGSSSPKDSLKKRPPGQAVSPLEKMELDRWVLTAIIHTPAETIALVEESTGKGYPVRIGTRIGAGGGEVVAIDGKGIIVEEQGQTAAGKTVAKRRVLRFADILNE